MLSSYAVGCQIHSLRSIEPCSHDKWIQMDTNGPFGGPVTPFFQKNIVEAKVQLMMVKMRS